MSGSPTPRTQSPPRLLPVLYFGATHVALALAFGAVAIDPRGVSGFFYHARMLGIVHLIALGWITASILGSLYLVGPIALRVWIPATWLDYTAFALVLIGIVGMVAHFWIQDYASMAWSAADHIAWHCSVCGDNGFIHGWEDTLWNRQGGECAESSETPPTTSH